MRSMRSLIAKLPEFHEAGNAVITLSLGGIINHELVEIADRWHCGSRFFPRNDPAKHERLTVFNAMAGWRAEYLHHGKGAMRDGQDNAEDLEYVLECLRSGDDEECEELGSRRRAPDEAGSASRILPLTPTTRSGQDRCDGVPERDCARRICRSMHGTVPSSGTPS